MPAAPRTPVDVARDLTAIEDLALRILTQAIHHGSDRELPGGNAMVALAHVANSEAYNHQIGTHERMWEAAVAAGLVDADDQPDWTAAEHGTWEPPLQTLTHWSQKWRAANAMEHDQTPTLGSEINFIRWALDWSLANEPHWQAFAHDMKDARARLENLLHAGVRSERGVPCMYDGCRGIRLVRKLVPGRDPATGAKTWRHTPWHCPRCHREWDDDAYARNITAAHERTKSEDIDGHEWCSLDRAARRTGRSVETIRTWVKRGEVPTACIIAGRRKPFVRLDDIRARHEQAKRRNTTSRRHQQVRFS